MADHKRLEWSCCSRFDLDGGHPERERLAGIGRTQDLGITTIHRQTYITRGKHETQRLPLLLPIVYGRTPDFVIRQRHLNDNGLPRKKKAKQQTTTTAIPTAQRRKQQKASATTMMRSTAARTVARVGAKRSMSTTPKTHKIKDLCHELDKTRPKEDHPHVSYVTACEHT